MEDLRYVPSQCNIPRSSPQSVACHAACAIKRKYVYCSQMTSFDSHALSNCSGQRSHLRTAHADAETLLDRQNRFTAATFRACISYLKVDTWSDFWSGEQAFTDAHRREMYLGALKKILHNHQSHNRSMENFKSALGVKKYGGHPKGDVPFEEPTLDDCPPVDQEAARRNERLGRYWYRRRRATTTTTTDDGDDDEGVFVSCNPFRRDTSGTRRRFQVQTKAGRHFRVRWKRNDRFDPVRQKHGPLVGLFYLAKCTYYVLVCLVVNSQVRIEMRVISSHL